MKQVVLSRYDKNTMSGVPAWDVGLDVTLDSGRVVHVVDTILESEAGSAEKDAIVDHAMRTLLPNLEPKPADPRELRIPSDLLGGHRHD